MNQPPYYKDMTGWNRKAICVIVPALANDSHMQAAEKICTLAASEIRHHRPAPVAPVAGEVVHASKPSNSHSRYR